MIRYSREGWGEMISFVGKLRHLSLCMMWLCLFFLAGCGNPDRFKEPIQEFTTASKSMFAASNQFTDARFTARRNAAFYGLAYRGKLDNAVAVNTTSSPFYYVGVQSGDEESLKEVVANHPNASDLKALVARRQAYAAIANFYDTLGQVAGAEIGPQAEAAFNQIVTNLQKGPFLQDLDPKSSAIVRETGEAAKLLFGALIEHRREQILNEGIGEAGPALKRTAQLVGSIADSDHEATLADLFRHRNSLLREYKKRQGAGLDAVVQAIDSLDLRIKNQILAKRELDQAVKDWQAAVDGLIQAGQKEDFNYALAGISKFFSQAITLRKAIEGDGSDE